MTAERWTRVGAVAAIADGTAWLLKLLVLVLARGVEGPVDVGLFHAGFLLLSIGATGIGLRLVRPRSRGAQIVTVIASLVAFLAIGAVTTALSEAVYGADSPAGAEGGIVVVALLGTGAGGLALRRRPRTSPAATVAESSRV